ncbi:DNA-binding protein [Acidovorax sp. Leaf76]|uniref:non-homologous end joining protein Ku n=1 Tax=unclassified Acidovorax TaxID=2684926 RepID=UPI0006F45540|nr:MULTISPECIES: Ku protein [unclassified Acidovorax]KQO16160.1 DNA-binding protein [Acidovorax sp. Leaf76]KQO32233.1 DNA-binding protein [Acidovorax sp. Leaf84]KQS31793.1 DNA-binding protein [Acidovorax sp. Leaf191]
MATGSRTLWKGAITFGLVHIPVGLHTASSEQGVDFDWLDKRSMDPVGYKRINKRTGKEIDKDNIVKGVEYEDGKYVIISPEEIEAVFPKTTQTIEIQRFIGANEMPFIFLERPYYVAPINKSDKVYALLRETLVATGKIGLAKVVIATKQHLAALVPSGPALVLNLLRWGDEVKTLDSLDLPASGKNGVSAAELKMAKQLVEEMSGPWDPEDFKDEFRLQVMKLVDKKAKAGEGKTVLEPQEEAPKSGAVIDLTALLQRSLKGGGKSGAKPPAKTPARKAAAKAAPAKKAAAQKKAA